MASVLLHIPHASKLIPSEWRKNFFLTDEELDDELRIMTDSYTDELFELGSEADVLRFPVSRLLVDPERFPDNDQEPMASRGMGAIYTKTHDGRHLKSDEHATTLMAEYYVPHHTQMTKWVEEQLRSNQKCLIIDCHSFPSASIPCDLDRHSERLDICLGTSPPHTPPSLLNAAISAFGENGYTVSVDQPYAGSIVPLKWYGIDPRVSSIMVEVNRNKYMDEKTGERSGSFLITKQCLQKALRQVVSCWLPVKGIKTYSNQE